MRAFIEICEGPEVDYRVEVSGFHHDQLDAKIVARMLGKPVGFLHFSVFRGDPSIRMIEVSPEVQRQGIARGMLKALQAEYPDVEIDWGMLTQDGSKLYDNIKFRDVEVPEVAEKVRRLELLKKTLAGYQELADRVYRDNDPEDRKAFDAIVDGWNELSDEADRLTFDLYGKRPVKRIIDEDELVQEISDAKPLKLDAIKAGIQQNSKLRAKLIGEIGDVEVYMSRPISGKWHGIIFKSDDSALGYAVLHVKEHGLEVAEIGLMPELRWKGVGYQFYLLLLDQGFTLVSGQRHTPDGRKVWEKLRNDPSVATHVIVANQDGWDSDDDIDPWTDPSAQIVATKATPMIAKTPDTASLRFR